MIVTNVCMYSSSAAIFCHFHVVVRMYNTVDVNGHIHLDNCSSPVCVRTLAAAVLEDLHSYFLSSCYCKSVAARHLQSLAATVGNTIT